MKKHKNTRWDAKTLDLVEKTLGVAPLVLDKIGFISPAS